MTLAATLNAFMAMTSLAVSRSSRSVSLARRAANVNSCVPRTMSSFIDNSRSYDE